MDHVPSIQATIRKIKKKSAVQDIVFLDYNTNCDVFDFSKPLSHAALVKLYIEDNYPCIETYQEWKKTDGQNEPKGKKVRSSNKQEYGQLDLFQ